MERGRIACSPSPAMETLQPGVAEVPGPLHFHLSHSKDHRQHQENLGRRAKVCADALWNVIA